MTPAEVSQLLAAAMAYDNRKANPATIHAWTEAADRGRWSYQEALDAIHAHYADTSEFLMPGHITQRIRSRRQQPAPPSEAQPLPAGNATRSAADPVHIRSLIGALGQQLGWYHDDPEPDATRRALAVQCPHCEAVPGKRCSRQVARGHRRGQFVHIARPHPTRIERAEQE